MSQKPKIQPTRLASFRHTNALKVSQDAEIALSLSFPALKTRLPPHIPSLHDSLRSMLGIPTEDEIVFVRIFWKYTLNKKMCMWQFKGLTYLWYGQRDCVRPESDTCRTRRLRLFRCFKLPAPTKVLASEVNT